MIYILIICGLLPLLYILFHEDSEINIFSNNKFKTKKKKNETKR